MSPETFADRRDAGRQLAASLQQYASEDCVVLALPRGGVPVGYEVAQALEAPLDVLVVRKLGVPGHEELAFGAVASGGIRVLNDDVVRVAGLTPAQIDAVTEEQRVLVEERERHYRGERASVEVTARTAVVVDDGLATGASMRAGVEALRAAHPARVVVGVPVGAPSTCAMLGAVADDVVCVRAPDPFFAVGVWYADFRQTTDEEVRRLLQSA